MLIKKNPIKSDCSGLAGIPSGVFNRLAGSFSFAGIL